MAFYLRYPHARELVAVLPGNSTVGGTTSAQICSSDEGRLCVTASTILDDIGATLPAGSTFAGFPAIMGIVAYVPTDTTAGSTIPFYIEKIKPGDVVECGYSTDIETSTAGTSSYMVTSNIGYYFGPGYPGVSSNNSTALIIGMYLDGSIASTAYAATTSAKCFKLAGFSTVDRRAWGTFCSSNLVP